MMVLLSLGKILLLRMADIFYSNKVVFIFITDKCVSGLPDCSPVTLCSVYALDKYGLDIDPKVKF